MIYEDNMGFFGTGALTYGAATNPFGSIMRDEKSINEGDSINLIVKEEG